MKFFQIFVVAFTLFAPAIVSDSLAHEVLGSAHLNPHWIPAVGIIALVLIFLVIYRILRKAPDGKLQRH